MTDGQPASPVARPAGKWDPALYLGFEGLRLRPALDLIDRIPLDRPDRIVDLGCGAGNVAAHLASRWPDAEIVGVDASEDMLDKARRSGLRARWIAADISDWAPERPVDLIFTNAALNWVDGHDALLPRLVGALSPGGAFAMQVPANHQAPSHTAAFDAAQPFKSKLESLLRPAAVQTPRRYFDILSTRAASLDIWETTYMQLLDGEDPVARWTSGTFLRPFLDALDEPDRSAFERDYRLRLREAYPTGADGTTLFPFKRLFIVATV